MNRSILVVDDDKKIVDLVALYLKRDGYSVLPAYDGQEALDTARRRRPDLIVLDLMLPELSGMDVCKLLRAESRVPIVMLTARAADEDKLRGLDLGADDYVTKPFNPRELVARVRAVLRRAYPEETPGDDLQLRRPGHQLPAPRGNRRRQAREPDADRVSAAGNAGARAGPGLLALRAARPGLRLRLRRRRAHGRRTHHEPAAQDRARAAARGATSRPCPASATASRPPGWLVMLRSLRVRLPAGDDPVVLIAVGVTAFVATRRTEGEFQRYVERRSPVDARRLGVVLARYLRRERRLERRPGRDRATGAACRAARRAGRCRRARCWPTATTSWWARRWARGGRPPEPSSSDSATGDRRALPRPAGRPAQSGRGLHRVGQSLGPVRRAGRRASLQSSSPCSSRAASCARSAT